MLSKQQCHSICAMWSLQYKKIESRAANQVIFDSEASHALVEAASRTKSAMVASQSVHNKDPARDGIKEATLSHNSLAATTIFYNNNVLHALSQQQLILRANNVLHAATSSRYRKDLARTEVALATRCITHQLHNLAKCQEAASHFCHSQN